MRNVSANQVNGDFNWGLLRANIMTILTIVDQPKARNLKTALAQKMQPHCHEEYPL